MVETVDTRCELPQAQLFEGRQLEDSGRHCFLGGLAVQEQIRVDELVARHAARERIELRAIPNEAEEALRLVGRHS